MTLYAEDKTRAKRGKAKEAIALALESRWEEAVGVNRAILEEFPRDVEAYNRLGKALSELGRYSEAADAFRQALQMSRANVIARKNLERLAHLKEATPLPKQGAQVPPRLFIEESGKTTTVSLTNLSPAGAHLQMAPGDAVDLKMSGSAMTVESLRGEYLGGIEPKLASRLARLIRGGNTYAAAVIAVNELSLAIMIKETHQHPSQRDKVSFPSRAVVDELHPYLRTPYLPFDLEQEEKEEVPGRLPNADWEEDEGEVTAAVPLSNEDEEDPSPKDEFEE